MKLSNGVDRFSDQRMELIISNLLRAGVLLSALVVALGGLIYLKHQGTAAPNYGVFRGEPTDLRTVSGIMSDVRSLRGRGIIQLGLLILISTPVARVVFLLVGFALERDALYFFVALLVLLILGFSLVRGHF